jgi:glucosamine-6-phosphate deaminase
MEHKVFSSAQEASLEAAGRIAAAIKANKGRLVLGLPTGSTPLGVYAELSRLCGAGDLSFRDVVTFNMDEYLGLPPEHPESYRYFMEENLFRHIDIRPENAHILNGLAADPEAECAAYEAAIKEAGGIGLFLGGVGGNGHIAFNEPPADPASRTRVVTLTPETRKANSRFFGGDPLAVPEKALSVGIATVMEARELLFLAFGAAKSEAVSKALKGPPAADCPASFLALHQCCTLFTDF